MLSAPNTQLSTRAQAVAFALFLACAPLLSAAPLVKDELPIILFNGRDFDGLHIFTENAALDPATVWKI